MQQCRCEKTHLIYSHFIISMYFTHHINFSCIHFSLLQLGILFSFFFLSISSFFFIFFILLFFLLVLMNAIDFVRLFTIWNIGQMSYITMLAVIVGAPDQFQRLIKRLEQETQKPQQQWRRRQCRKVNQSSSSSNNRRHIFLYLSSFIVSFAIQLWNTFNFSNINDLIIYHEGIRHIRYSSLAYYFKHFHVAAQHFVCPLISFTSYKWILRY